MAVSKTALPGPNPGIPAKMSANNDQPLKIEKFPSNPGVFLQRFGSSIQYYIAARISLVNGLSDPGVILAHQSIELLVKAILLLNYQKHGNHDLVTLFESSKNINPFFKYNLNKAEIKELLSELTNAYGDKKGSLRYSEAKSEINLHLIIPLLDEIIFGLKQVYESTINYPKPVKIYCPQELKITLLKDNKFFTKETLTDNSLSTYGIPIF